MKLSELVGVKVKLARKTKKGCKISGLYTIEQITDHMILARKEAGYVETLNIIDLRQQIIRLFLENGKEILFRPMKNIIAQEKARLKKITDEYRENQKARESIMALMTKEIVRRMAAEGNTVDQITGHFLSSYPQMQPSMVKAKVTMLLSDKKPGAPKKAITNQPTNMETFVSSIDIAKGEKEMGKNKYDRHEELCKDLNSTYRKKNVAYGDAFGRTFRKYGMISALTRMSDKWNRIEALSLGAENQITDESILDTLKDLACYCLMTIVEMEEKKDEST